MFNMVVTHHLLDKNLVLPHVRASKAPVSFCATRLDIWGLQKVPSGSPKGERYGLGKYDGTA